MTPGGGPDRRKSDYFNICVGANGKLCKLTPVAALTAFNTLDGKKKILHQSIGKKLKTRIQEYKCSFFSTNVVMFMQAVFTLCYTFNLGKD